MSSLLDSSITFKELAASIGLDNRLQKGVSRLGHVRPTLVQAKCLPLAIRDGRDLLVKARTGSGKTLAYCLPLLQKILSKEQTLGSDGVQGIILVPTKDLCAQVSGIVASISYYATETIRMAVLAGTSKADRARQEAMLRDDPNVIVATPASLLYFLNKLQHFKSKVQDTVETLVVDEADLVLSFGHTDDISEIVKCLPKICQSLLMSATLPDELAKLKSVLLNSPAIVKLEEENDHDCNDDANSSKTKLISQFYLSVPQKDKNLILYVFLKLGLLKGKGLFFVNSTDAAYRLKLFLELFHIRSAVLNEELPLQSRLHILEHFNVGNFDYLICTDGFSRGTDFRMVSFVVNVELPTSAEEYIHRIGRTARGGHKGVALTLVSQELQSDWDMLSTIQTSQPTLKRTQKNSNAGGLLQVQRPDEENAWNDIPQPSPLDFDLSEAEGFRYRVEDVSHAITKVAIKEARANELKAEILNNDRLANHLGNADLQLLRHDRIASKPTLMQEHLKHVPKYMLPRGMQVAELHKRRKKRKVLSAASNGKRRTDNDPLQNFNDTPDAEGAFDEFIDEDGGEGSRRALMEEKIYSSTKDGLGKSTSGRAAWKKQHKKGKFSGKNRKSDPKRRRIGI